MAGSSGWSSEVQKDSEEKNPVPPYSRCTAIRDFVGQWTSSQIVLLIGSTIVAIVCYGTVDPSYLLRTGQQPQDLSFRCGEQLTIIEPCNVVFWYLAENSEGKRGVIPINFVKVELTDCMCK